MDELKGRHFQQLRPILYEICKLPEPKNYENWAKVFKVILVIKRRNFWHTEICVWLFWYCSLLLLLLLFVIHLAFIPKNKLMLLMMLMMMMMMMMMMMFCRFDAVHVWNELPVCIWRSQVANHRFVQLVNVLLSGNEYCEPNVTRDYPNGDIAVEVEWPATLVGSRRIVRCAYAYDQPSYAHRDCTLSSADQEPKWNDPNVTSCPDPPFSQGIDRLASFTVSDSSSTTTTTTTTNK